MTKLLEWHNYHHTLDSFFLRWTFSSFFVSFSSINECIMCFTSNILVLAFRERFFCKLGPNTILVRLDHFYSQERHSRPPLSLYGIASRQMRPWLPLKPLKRRLLKQLCDNFQKKIPKKWRPIKILKIVKQIWKVENNHIIILKTLQLSTHRSQKLAESTNR